MRLWSINNDANPDVDITAEHCCTIGGNGKKTPKWYPLKPNERVFDDESVQEYEQQQMSKEDQILKDLDNLEFFNGHKDHDQKN